MGITYSYSQVKKVETGFGTKSFTIGRSERKGEFFYRILIQDRWIDFSSTSPNEDIERYQQDTYLELEEFDQNIMKYKLDKVSSKAGEKDCELDRRYVERFLRIIANKL